jgi:Asp-tRNA(Asn)/Glu-tRNA(Gln) amidotransferase A subunit family amidase
MEEGRIMVADTFELNEATIDDIQRGMKSGRLTAGSITQLYLARIELLDKHVPAINSVVELNPTHLQLPMNLIGSTSRRALVGLFTAYRSCSRIA